VALVQINERLGSTEHAYREIEKNLVLSLGFLKNNRAMYLKTGPQLCREINRALSRRIYVDQSGDVRGELAGPFDTLLSRPVRHLGAAHARTSTGVAGRPLSMNPGAPKRPLV
jgi:hypothetical protein